MIYNVLIKAIKLGDIASDGGPATTFAALGDTLKDTLTVEPTDPTFEDVNVEEKDAPVLSVMTDPGGLKLGWTVFEWDSDLLVKVWGGTVVDGQWQKPPAVPTIEKSLRIEPKVGKPLIYPHCQLSAQQGYDTTKKIFTIAISAKVLQPTKAGVPSFMVGDPED
jgi:hypothetical protein